MIMCRVISFVSVKGGIGKTSIIYEVSKVLSEKDLKVCVFDAYFNINNLSNLYNERNSNDLKEYILGRLGTYNVLNRYRHNLYYAKTDNDNFDYLKHLNLISFFINEISEYFDFILIDVNNFCVSVLESMIMVSNEVLVVIGDDDLEIKNAKNLVSKIKNYNNIKSLKIIINKKRIIATLNKKVKNKNCIEKILNSEVVFQIPKFYKNNLLNIKNVSKNKKKLIDNLCYSIITNNYIDLGEEKRYKGIVGFLKKMKYFKYE